MCARAFIYTHNNLLIIKCIDKNKVKLICWKMGGCTITRKYNTFRNRNNAQDSVSVTSMTLLALNLRRECVIAEEEL